MKRTLIDIAELKHNIEELKLLAQQREEKTLLIKAQMLSRRLGEIAGDSLADTPPQIIAATARSVDREHRRLAREISAVQEQTLARKQTVRSTLQTVLSLSKRKT